MFFVSARFWPVLSAKQTLTYLVFLCFSILGAQETSFFVSPGTKISGAENIFVANSPNTYSAHSLESTHLQTSTEAKVVWVTKSVAKQKEVQNSSSSLATAKKLEPDASFLEAGKKQKPSLYNQTPFTGTPKADFSISQNVFTALPSSQVEAKAFSNFAYYNPTLVFVKDKAVFVYNSPVLLSFCVDFYPNRPPPCHCEDFEKIRSNPETVV